MSEKYEESKLEQYVAVMEEAARAAGKLIQEMFQKPKDASVVSDKTVASIDLVTDTDQACEKLIFEILRSNFPTFELLGEETASESGSYSLSEAPTFIVDPVDGTTNAVHRNPDVCVSIGLSFQKEAVAGVVYDPCRDELFRAWRGGGAFCNQKKLRVDDQVTELNQCVISSNIGYQRDETSVNHCTGTVANLMKENLRGLRMQGSACNQMTCVAYGRSNCFYESGPHPWDVCAAAICVTEAGGFLLNMDGGPFTLTSRKYIAACNETIAQKVLACIVSPMPYADWK